MKDISARQFRNLTAQWPVGFKRHNVSWLCLCVCGNLKIVPGGRLQNGNTGSCGCKMGNHRHGHDSRKSGRTAEYIAWTNMKKRCSSPTPREAKTYGHVTICERWVNSFENFFADMGRKPSLTYSLDRINGDGNYEPSNCRWATPSQQNKNRKWRTRYNDIRLREERTAKQ
jgi:hypothetical protein